MDKELESKPDAILTRIQVMRWASHNRSWATPKWNSLYSSWEETDSQLRERVRALIPDARTGSAVAVSNYLTQNFLYWRASMNHEDHTIEVLVAYPHLTAHKVEGVRYVVSAGIEVSLRTAGFFTRCAFHIGLLKNRVFK